MSINSIIDHPQILNPKPKEIKLLTDSQHPSFKKLDNLEKEITEKKPIGSCAKILIAGPPHSGKSVFERGLRKSFPSVLDVTRIAAQPDGEGDWTNDLYSADPDLAKSLRIKGKFTRDNVEHWKTQITNSNNRFNLIDVGGVISPENAEIADLANSIIIVSRDKESAKEWIRFANEHNLNILGVFESTLDEDRQDEERFDVVSGKEWETEGVIYGLDRKSFVSSETIKFLVAYLLDRVPAPEAKTELAPGYTTITMDNIVTAIGKVYESKELPGRIGEFQINWSPEDLPKVYKELSRIGSLGGKFVIQGVAPQ